MIQQTLKQAIINSCDKNSNPLELECFSKNPFNNYIDRYNTKVLKNIHV